MAFDHSLATLLLYNEDQQYSYSDSKFSKCCSIGVVSGNSSIAVCKVGILQSIASPHRLQVMKSMPQFQKGLALMTGCRRVGGARALLA